MLVTKADPTQRLPGHTLPTGLTAIYGDTLSTVVLPSGYTWKTPTDLVGDVATRTHTVTYTPVDTAIYSIITGSNVEQLVK